MHNWTLQRYKNILGRSAWTVLLLALCSCGKKVTLEPGDRLDPFEENTKTQQTTPTLSPDLLSKQHTKSHGWIQPGYNAQHVMGPFCLGSSLSILQKVKVSQAYRVPIGPIANKECVFVLTSQGTVAAFSMNGQKKWETSVVQKEDNAFDLSGGLACDSERVYVTTPQKKLVALDIGSGKILWTRVTRAPARSGPCLSGKNIIIATNDSCVHLIDKKTGKRLWEHISSLSDNTSLIHSATPAIHDDQIIAANTAGELLAIHQEQGTLLWSQNVSSEPKESSIVHIAAMPVIDQKHVYSLSYNGQMTCCNKETGDIVWIQKIKSYHPPVIHGSVLFVVGENNTLNALNRYTGALYWTKELPKNIGDASAPLCAGKYLYITGSRGIMIALDPAQKGKVVQEWNLGTPCTTAPIIVENTLIVLSDTGSLIFLGPSRKSS